MSDKPFQLPLLLVTEAIRELEQRFANMNDKNSHIETHICNLGKKPGFVLVAQLLRSSNECESLDEKFKFIANRFCNDVFQAKASYTSQNNNLTITFNEVPPWFRCLNPSTQHTPQQIFWFRAYGHFVMGVICGALLHFGIKATPKFDNSSPLTLSFKYEELQGTWEFASNVQH